LFDTIEQQIRRKQVPIYLFKNIVKRNSPDKALRTCQSTFITLLRTEQAFRDMRTLVIATIE
ncbi:hypothetical protein KI387_006767, partial [Taxus chinensis]